MVSVARSDSLVPSRQTGSGLLLESDTTYLLSSTSSLHQDHVDQSTANAKVEMIRIIISGIALDPRALQKEDYK